MVLESIEIEMQSGDVIKTSCVIVSDAEVI